ncbi:MAG: glycosyltransferase, partial [Candidatus Eremiobacteraeota bacterium]|nr:glycosyltransferase [Candidatus Eremiobacteraeota bacterium]
MRVMLLAEHFSPRLGGAARACSELARGLAAQGVELVVVADRDAGLPEFERLDGFEIHRLELTSALERGDPRSVLLQARRLAEIVEASGPHLCHLSGGALSFYYATRLMMRREQPWVTTIHLPRPASA